MSVKMMNERKRKVSFLCTSAILCLLFQAVMCAGALRADEKKAKKKKERPYDPTSAYEIRKIEGWRVYVLKRLEKEKPEILRKAMRLVGLQLYQITLVVPDGPLEKLREVPIWVCDRKDGPIHFHPNRGWLVTNGYNPDKAKAVDISRVANIVNSYRTQRWVLLHELAHAYHNRVLGFNHPKVLQAYRNAKKSKKYESVLLHNGRKVRHYALTNEKEYFAECTEAFFGTNDFYPFVRSELKEHDPGVYKVLEEVWGRRK